MTSRPFEVAESSCVPKISSGATQSGDDLFVVTPDFAAVLDGAGSWSGHLSGLTPGRFAAEDVAGGIQVLPPDVSIAEAAEALSESLRLALANAAPGTRPFPVDGGSFDDRTYLRLNLA